jgi:hypothetical protein
MASRLDELFDPDRLRRHWEQPAAPVADAAPAGPNAAVHAQYRELLERLAAHYPGATALPAVLAELDAALAEAFPEDAVGETAAPAQRGATVALLERLEDIVWALDLARAGR